MSLFNVFRCGHCKKLAPEWKKASSNLKGKVKLGHVDCDAEKVSPIYLKLNLRCVVRRCLCERGPFFLLVLLIVLLRGHCIMIGFLLFFIR